MNFLAWPERLISYWLNESKDNDVDDFDRASEVEAQFQAASLAKHRQQHPTFAGTSPQARNCIDCGFPIPAVRLDALPGAVRCVDCQQQRERRHV